MTYLEIARVRFAFAAEGWCVIYPDAVDPRDIVLYPSACRALRSICERLGWDYDHACMERCGPDDPVYIAFDETTVQAANYPNLPRIVNVSRIHDGHAPY